MIIVTLTYKKPLSEVDMLLQEHVLFLDYYYAEKKFLASGRRENRAGGVILVLSDDLEEAKKIMQKDPFYIHDVADYDFMWFEVSKCLNSIAPS
ncbi:YciI family protein [Acinetobacter rathckeae]|uniref:YciI family protein n=1 Tax=Acinetobacter rathckeae TaxID=2605272 RepID=UPI0018A2F118|nr:YciI family protein [Acinetobacter rathckeae]MBF7687349.1 GTP cyclohydrolase [Acinetobacter rathckeae]MBF7694750.1 GTP cyclohydrolase [Acinetobacter rathckeae]